MIFVKQLKFGKECVKAHKGKEPPEFMSTHPSTTNRISNITEWINEIILKVSAYNINLVVSPVGLEPTTHSLKAFCTPLFYAFIRGLVNSFHKNLRFNTAIKYNNT